MNWIKRIILRLGTRIKKPGVVLYGHNVTEHDNAQVIPSLHLSPQQLDYNIRLFKDVGYTFIGAEELASLAEVGFPKKKAWVHLTFDDGYQDNHDTILPILESHNVPATIYISSNHIEHNLRFYTYSIKVAILNTNKSFSHKGWQLNSDDSKDARLKFYRNVVDDFKLMRTNEALEFIDRIMQLLTADKWETLNAYHSSDAVLDMNSLKQLSEHPLITIGSHNHHHLIMNMNMKQDEIEFQMSTSKKWLQEHLDVECFTYCYPNGQQADFTSLSKEISGKYYRTVFTTLSGYVSSKNESMGNSKNVSSRRLHLNN